MTQSTTSNDPEEQHRALVDQYAALRVELSDLHSQPAPDLAAIDRVMARIDAVQMALKASQARSGDPQRY